MRKFVIFFILLLLPAFSFAQDAVKGVIPGLTLSDQHGKNWSDEDFKGKYALVHIGFSRCADDCPVVLPLMGDVLTRLEANSKQVTAVFINIDTRDNADTIKKYMKNFDPRIVALLGNQEQMDKVINEYEIYTATTINQNTGAITIVQHAPNLFLIGRDGIPIGSFEPNQSAAEISSIIQQIINDKMKNA